MFQTRSYHSFIPHIQRRYKEKYGVDLPPAIIKEVLMRFMGNIVLAMKKGHDITILGIKLFFDKQVIKKRLDAKRNQP